MEYTVLTGDCVESMRGLPDNSVHCCVTSPPYWGLRDYGHSGQLGMEKTPEEYAVKLMAVFAEVRRVLRPDGTLWLNLGDSYLAGKQLGGIPWRVAFALQADGWYLRQDIIWHKPNPMPSSVTDRCTTAHEYIFLLAKSERYFYDAEAIKEESIDKESLNGRRPRKTRKDHTDEGQASLKTKFTARGGFLNGKMNDAGRLYLTRNRRSVWKVSTKPYKGAHFATMPWDLAETCILAGTSAEGCCSNCRAPLVRQTARTKLKRERPNAYVKRTGEEGTGNSCANDVAGVAVETIGWRPTCGCNAQVAPAVVLDPFAGSGTTLGVAVAHGRSAVGCELNPDYVGLIDERVKSLYKAIRPVAENRNLPLFDGVCDG
jgi:DNA modification methylase